MANRREILLRAEYYLSEGEDLLTTIQVIQDEFNLSESFSRELVEEAQTLLMG